MRTSRKIKANPQAVEEYLGVCERFVARAELTGGQAAGQFGLTAGGLAELPLIQGGDF